MKRINCDHCVQTLFQVGKDINGVRIVKGVICIENGCFCDPCGVALPVGSVGFTVTHWWEIIPKDFAWESRYINEQVIMRDDRNGSNQTA